MAQVVDLFMIYQFLKRLVQPFKEWEAYKLGVIDENGNVIVPKNERTKEQKKAWGYFDRLVANIKKLIMKVPGGKSKIATWAAALLLIKEHKNEKMIKMLAENNDVLEERFNEIYEEILTTVTSGVEKTTDAVYSRERKKKKKKNVLNRIEKTYQEKNKKENENI